MKVYRYEIPVDGRWHDIDMTGPVVKVGTRHEDLVELWALAAATTAPQTRSYCVFGTGLDVPTMARHVGSALTPSGAFAWHLFEITRAPNGLPDRGR